MQRFSVWRQWSARNEHARIELPGVYVVARSHEPLAGEPFSWRPDIIYIGMTNALAGLRGRLQQFDNTIAGRRTQHGGAERVRYKYRRYDRLCRLLYVAVAAFPCDVGSERPADLRVMGKVAQYEYESIARFAEHFKRLPEFNDKKKSPKHAPRTRSQARRRGAA